MYHFCKIYVKLTMKKTYLLFLCLFSVLSAFAQAPDENRFVKTVLVEKLDEPMVMAYLPDGKILMIERKGDIKQFGCIVKNRVSPIPKRMIYVWE